MSHEWNEGLEDQRREIRARLAAPDRRGQFTAIIGVERRASPARGRETFFVVQQGEAVLAALEYRVVGRILLLGPLFSDPWGLERLAARALCAEAHILAREAGLREVRATAIPWSDALMKSGTGGGDVSGERRPRSRWFSAASFLRKAGAGCFSY